MTYPELTTEIIDLIDNSDGTCQVADEEFGEHFAEATSLRYNGRVSAAKARRFPKGSVLIVAFENGTRNFKSSLAVKPAYNLAELDAVLEVEARAFFGDVVDLFPMPVCVFGRAVSWRRGSALSLRAAGLDVAYALGCNMQLGFNADVTGIVEATKPFNYFAKRVEPPLDKNKVNEGPHSVTGLPRHRFQVVSAEIQARAAAGFGHPTWAWSEDAKLRLARFTEASSR